ncbi:MAG TPA: metal-dependent hydrolase, partial [Gammaproteobacteria bacterium]|nr:metal-dependent hydrolase [Gammaproteobacteria bacterium]
GPCRSNGKIIINTHLARYPLNCVDVVIVHELCHLLEFNHSRHFYRLMDQAMPDWKTHDAMLNRLSLLY